MVLCLLYSNACVERIFLALNLLKTDFRNRLEFDIIEAITYVKEYLKANNVSSENLRITKKTRRINPILNFKDFKINHLKMTI